MRTFPPNRWRPGPTLAPEPQPTAGDDLRPGIRPHGRPGAAPCPSATAPGEHLTSYTRLIHPHRRFQKHRRCQLLPVETTPLTNSRSSPERVPARDRLLLLHANLRQEGWPAPPTPLRPVGQPLPDPGGCDPGGGGGGRGFPRTAPTPKKIDLPESEFPPPWVLAVLALRHNVIPTACREEPSAFVSTGVSARDGLASAFLHAAASQGGWVGDGPTWCPTPVPPPPLANHRET